MERFSDSRINSRSNYLTSTETRSRPSEPLRFDESLTVVWALDAFPDKPEAQLTVAWLLEKLFPLSTIYPVYVMSDVGFAEGRLAHRLRPAMRPAAERAMASLVAEIRFLDVKRPRILFDRSSSYHATAHRLLRFARHVGAQLIAVGSHGRKGLSRLLSGSFSEAVISQSLVPVIIAGPQTERLRVRPTQIVYPTDFSPACEVGFAHVLSVARLFGAEVHLYHKTVRHVDPLIQSGVQLLGGGWVSLESYLDPTSDPHRADAEAWLHHATTLGVNCRYVCENFREPTSEAIVDYLRRIRLASTMVALVPQAGPVTSALLGSITRDVIRQSPSPVYVVPRR